VPERTCSPAPGGAAGPAHLHPRTPLALPLTTGGRADSRIPCTQARALPRAPVPPPPAPAVAHSAWGALLLPAGTLPRDHALSAPPWPALEHASGVPRCRLRAWGVEAAARSRAQQHVLIGSEPHGPSVAHADTTKSHPPATTYLADPDEQCQIAKGLKPISGSGPPKIPKSAYDPRERRGRPGEGEEACCEHSNAKPWREGRCQGEPTCQALLRTFCSRGWVCPGCARARACTRADRLGVSGCRRRRRP
jgi:hypothetical protein